MPYAIRLPDGTLVQNIPDDLTPEQAKQRIISAGLVQPPAPPEPTFFGQVKEGFKGLVPGAVGLVEQAAVGASALLPEEYEKPTREAIAKVAGAAKAPFAAAPGYEETVGRKLGEAVGSTVPFLAAGPLGLAGRAAAVGLGVGAGAGEARTRAEKEGATAEQRATATGLGIIPGAMEVFAPFRILSRIPEGEVLAATQRVKRVLQAAGEEAAQEAASGLAQNMIARGVYKPEQELIEGLGEQAAYGGATGAIIQGLMDLAIGRRARGAGTGAETEPLIERRAREAAETPAEPTPPVAEAPVEVPAPVEPTAPEAAAPEVAPEVPEPIVRKPAEPAALPDVLDSDTIKKIGFTKGKVHDALVGKAVTDPEIRTVLEEYKQRPNASAKTVAKIDAFLARLPEAAPAEPPVAPPAAEVPVVETPAPPPAAEAPAAAPEVTPPTAEAAPAPAPEVPRVEPTEPEAGGAGTPVAGGPTTVTPTEGAGAVEPVRVVPAEPDAEQPAGGEKAEPVAVAPAAEPEYTEEDIDRAVDLGVLSEEEADAYRAELRGEEAPSTAMAAAFEERVAALKAQQDKLRQKNGKPPAPKSKNRAKYDELQAQIDALSPVETGTLKEKLEKARATGVFTVKDGKPILDIPAVRSALKGRDPKMLKAVLTYIGVDEDGNYLPTTYSADEAAQAVGMAKSSGANVRRIAETLGITADVISRFQAAQTGIIGIAKNVSEASLSGIPVENPKAGLLYETPKTPLLIEEKNNLVAEQKALEQVDAKSLNPEELKVHKQKVRRVKKRLADAQPRAIKSLHPALTETGELDFTKLDTRQLADIYSRASRYDAKDNAAVMQQLNAEVEARRKADRKGTDAAINRAYGKLVEEEEATVEREEAELETEPEVVEAEDTTRRLSDEETELFQIVPRKTIDSDVVTRLPSLKRKVDALNRKYETGQITGDQFAERLRWVLNDIEDAKLKTVIPRTVRGADYIRQRLLEAKRRGDLTTEAVDLAEWFVLKNPKLVEDLGISVRTPKEFGVGGMYEPTRRIAVLMKEHGNTDSIVHEVLHHLERMMPETVQKEISTVWAKSLLRAKEKTTDSKEKEFFDLIWNFHFGNGKQADYKKALELIQNRSVTLSNYQYASPSEFWAVNGSDIVQGRFNVSTSTAGKIKQWLKEFLQKAKSVFGLPSTAPVIRALDSLIKSDGKFVSKNLLTERDIPLPKQIVQQGIAPETEKAVEGVDVIAEQAPALTPKGNPALKARIKFADSLAGLEDVFTAAYSGQVRTATGRLNPMVLLSRALDTQRVSRAVQKEGTLVTKEGLLMADKLVVDGREISYKDTLARIAETAKKEGKTYEQYRDTIDKVLYGHLEYNLREYNRNLDQQADALEAAGKTKEAKAMREDKITLALNDKQIDTLEAAFQKDTFTQGISKDLDAIRFSMLDKLVEVGRISEDKAKEWKENTGYIPLQRITEYAKEYDEAGRGTNRGVVAMKNIRKREGSKRATTSPVENFSQFMDWAVGEAMKNEAGYRALTDLELLGSAKRQDDKPAFDSPGGMVTVYEKGVPTKFYVQDPGLFVGLSLQEKELGSIAKAFQRFGTQPLRAGVTALPPFAVKQVFDDIVRAYTYAGVKNNAAVVKNILLNFPKNWYKEIFKVKDKGIQELENLGVIGTFDFTKQGNLKNILEEAGAKKEGLGSAIFRVMEAGAKASDLAVRQAIYQQVLKETGDVAQAESAAREIINFSRRGAAGTMQTLISVIPFFNAYAQGMDKLATAAAGRVVGTKLGVARSMFYKRMAVLTGMGLAYALLMSDDEDYQALPDHVRDTNWILPYGKYLGSTPAIPVPAELAFFFKAIPERVVQFYKHQGTDEERAALDVVKELLVRGVDVFSSPNLTPQLIRPFLENITNYSWFLGRPLESQAQLKQRPFMRAGTSTSDTMKVVAELLEDAANATGIEAIAISPIKLENTIRGLLGSSGGVVLALTDAAINPSRTDRPLHQQLKSQLTGASAVMKDAVGTRYLDKVYKLEADVEQVYNTYNRLLQDKPEKTAEFIEDNKGLYSIRPAVQGLMTSVRALNAAARQIDKATDITPDERRKRIDELRVQQNDLAKQALMLRKMAMDIQLGK